MTSMSIGKVLEIVPTLPSNVSILFRGPHGIGKSQIVRTLAKMIQERKNLDKLPVTDRRLSQMSEGDIIGLPSTDGEVTRFNPPDWYMQACKVPTVLFLDELNRATPEVMQAAFQIVLDRQLNGFELHPDTVVMSAVNTGGTYSVNEIDPALLDRFWSIDLAPTLADFTKWGRTENNTKPFKQNCAPIVVDFIELEEKWLDPPQRGEPGAVAPSRRSWERYGDALAHAGVLDKPEDAAFYSIGLGYVGTEATIAFTSYAKSVDNRVSGDEILNEYKKVEKKVKRLPQDTLLGCIDKLGLETSKLTKVTDKQGKNINAFMKFLPAELRIKLWSALTAGGAQRLDFIKSVHPHVVHEILDIYGVPFGPAGIGVMPNIPTALKGDETKSSGST